MTTLAVRGPAVIEGTTSVPGDKSISHRALMLAAAAEGRSSLRGIADGADVRSTRHCLEAYGVALRVGDWAVEVSSKGIHAWAVPPGPLDCGNSGTTMRLLSGLAARRPYETALDGDDSLRRRPMDRVVGPLRELGAYVEAREGTLPPLIVRGGRLIGRSLDLAVASAQVKSAVLLAGLGADGVTSVVEPARSRDHTERILGALAVPIRIDELDDGRRRLEVIEAEIPPFEMKVPGDVSSASFLAAAALLCGGVRVEGVGLNPTRTGFLDVAARMGAAVRREVTGAELGEPVGWFEAERSSLIAAGIEGPLVPQVLDELPLVAVLATQAEGTTVVSGAAELRVKESDRISAIVDGLSAMGAAIVGRADGFEVRGATPLVGAKVEARGDHRIAMSLAVAGLVASGETMIDGFECADISWPGFERKLSELGAEVELR